MIMINRKNAYSLNLGLNNMYGFASSQPLLYRRFEVIEYL